MYILITYHKSSNSYSLKSAQHEQLGISNFLRICKLCIAKPKWGEIFCEIAFFLCISVLAIFLFRKDISDLSHCTVGLRNYKKVLKIL